MTILQSSEFEQGVKKFALLSQLGKLMVAKIESIDPATRAIHYRIAEGPSKKVAGVAYNLTHVKVFDKLNEAKHAREFLDAEGTAQ